MLGLCDDALSSQRQLRFFHSVSFFSAATENRFDPSYWLERHVPLHTNMKVKATGSCGGCVLLFFFHAHQETQGEVIDPLHLSLIDSEENGKQNQREWEGPDNDWCPVLSNIQGTKAQNWNFIPRSHSKNEINNYD